MPPPTLEDPAVGCVGLRPEAAPPLGCGELWTPGAGGTQLLTARTFDNFAGCGLRNG